MKSDEREARKEIAAALRVLADRLDSDDPMPEFDGVVAALRELAAAARKEMS